MNQEFKRSFEISAHGGDLQAFSKRYHKREDEIIDFSSNVNPLGIPESLQSVYQASMDDLSLYPDPYAQLFCERIADLFRLSPENVIAGNGSIALLEVAIRFLRPKRALLIEPCFTEYRRLLKLHGAQIQHIPLSPKQDFQFTLERILKHLSKTDLLIFGHPNNPTGSALSVSEIHLLLKETRKKGVFMIVDEAFVDWIPELSVVNQVGDSNPLLVVRSMTKFFALAGIRSGFALGSRALIQAMANHLGLWNCNRLAQKLSIAAFSDLTFQEKTRSWLRGERAWLTQAIEQLEGFKVFPSLANFLLVRSQKPLHGFFDFLGHRGIYVRTVSDFVGLDDSYFRIAVRTRKENEYLTQVLNAWLEDHTYVSACLST